MIDKMEDQSILLVLGKGMENYQEIGREKIPYNDKKIIEVSNNADIVMAFTETRHFKH